MTDNDIKPSPPESPGRRTPARRRPRPRRRSPRTCRGGSYASRFVRYPCAGAMLIFSASFQFERMIPEGNPNLLRRTMLSVDLSGSEFERRRRRRLPPLARAAQTLEDASASVRERSKAEPRRSWSERPRLALSRKACCGPSGSPGSRGAPSRAPCRSRGRRCAAPPRSCILSYPILYE